MTNSTTHYYKLYLHWLILKGSFWQKIEHVREARFLGVIVDENITWEKHITCTLRFKIALYIGMMYKLNRMLPLQTIIQIYHSFVQSHDNYCSLVFSGKSHVENFLELRKKG